ncbi:hypothetical protein ABHC39_04245 [Pediococcus acidilactici]|uniref:hypothetical protein n=1 Tax=Pediococcus acidilactici TaxID=1254 RepID=UPI00232B2094|nr:hypothetical protein [Pediococcus acidilactici]MDB8867859.1 hypothetical protein [Pediococcus acidilactici]
MIFSCLSFLRFIVKTVLQANLTTMFSGISALAACASVIVSIHMTKRNLKLSKENNEINVAATKQNNFDNMFFKLLELLNKNIDAIVNANDSSFNAADLISNIKKSILKKKNQKSIDAQIKFVKENKEWLLEEFIALENLEICQIRENKGKIKGTNNTRPTIYNQQINSKEDLDKYSKKMFVEKRGITEGRMWTYTEVMYEIFNGIVKDKRNDIFYDTKNTGILFLDQFSMLLQAYGENEDIFNEYEIISKPFYKINNSKNILTHTDIEDVISEEFCSIKFGSFFSIVNRIAKIIKDQYKDDVINQNKYVGILRTQIPSLLLVCVYYNAEYLPEGKKLQDNLKDLNLWGDKEELENNIHVNATMFYNAGKEINNIIENYTRNDYEEGVAPEKN